MSEKVSGLLMEVLLPAFVIGCMTRICRPVDPWCEVLDESWEEYAARHSLA